jgi:hypothetical protein
LKENNGHVDILARIGKGRSSKLCIMELKDEYSKKEPPVKVLKQGLIYAAFIRALLRSKSGKQWWRIFGFNGGVSDPLILYVACVMPFKITGGSDKSFVNKEVALGRDSFRLHYLYFKEGSGKIAEVETSLGK